MGWIIPRQRVGIRCETSGLLLVKSCRNKEKKKGYYSCTRTEEGLSQSMLGLPIKPKRITGEQHHKKNPNPKKKKNQLVKVEIERCRVGVHAACGNALIGGIGVGNDLTIKGRSRWEKPFATAAGHQAKSVLVWILLFPVLERKGGGEILQLEERVEKFIAKQSRSD